MGLEDEECLDTILGYAKGSGWHIYSVIDNTKRAGTSPAPTNESSGEVYPRLIGGEEAWLDKSDNYKNVEEGSE
jgi:hypothetical protein